MTGYKVKHTVYCFGQRVWGMWSADKNIKNDHDSKWFEAYHKLQELLIGHPGSDP